ncbi:MAG: response regulator [Syntrophobacteraceae bacterium]
MSLHLSVLLVEDDEDDYALIRALLSDVASTEYHLDWVRTYDEALEAALGAGYDILLLDYRLGKRDGLELLRELSERNIEAPVIFFTGKGDYDLDIEAMKAGAADYLIKGEISAHLLERSIRYSIERKRSQDALRKSERQLKILSSQLLRVGESERKRIAAELHDDLGQILTAIKYGIEHTIGLMHQGTIAPEPLEAMVPTIQTAIEGVRRIYTYLRPSILDDLGIVATIGWYCREFGAATPRINIEKHIDVKEEEIPERLRVVIYRILQEALLNIKKHSRADHVEITLAKKDNVIELAVSDNGCGFDLRKYVSESSDISGLGLLSMKERVKLTGGSLHIETSEGSGTSIRSSWPV